MGNKSFKCVKNTSDNIVSGVVNITQRENLATWHRTDIPLTDVYEIMDTIGQGHMGNVYKVRRKVENRGLHNAETREKQSGAKDMDSSSHSVSSMGSILKSRQKKKLREKNEETLKKFVVDIEKPVTPKIDFKPKPILKKNMKYAVPSGVNINQTVASDSDKEDGGDDDFRFSNHPHFEDSESESLTSENDSSVQGEKKVEYRRSFFTGPIKRSESQEERDKLWVPKRKIRFQRLYACKTIGTEKIKGEDLKELMNEIYIMRKMDHPYIIRLYEVYQVNRNIWLVMDLCTGGNLKSRKLNEPETTRISEQILRGIAYLHRRGICHRDLKLENILYEDSTAGSSIRLIDFGLSETYDERFSKKRGAAYCMSPEVAGNSAPYTQKSDVWSIGVIVWILLAGDYPFLKIDEDLKDEQKIAKLINAKYEFGITWRGRGISEQAKAFARGCLKKDPKERWSAIEALEFLQDEWIPALEKKLAIEAEIVAERLAARKKKGAGESKETSTVLDSTHSSKSRKEHSIFDHDIMEDIIRFTQYGLLKKTALIALANTMDRKDVGKLSELFLMVDTEQTGTISPDELKQAFKNLQMENLDDELMEKIFLGIDHDRSGQIHYAEFLAALAEGAGLVTKERIADAFDRMDGDGKGYISHEDLKNILGEEYDMEMTNKMIEEGDFKKNGRVDYDEFVQLMSVKDDATK